MFWGGLSRGFISLSPMLGWGADELLQPDERARQIQLASGIGAAVALPFVIRNGFISPLPVVAAVELATVLLLLLPAFLLAHRRRFLTLAESLVLLAGYVIFGVLLIFRGVQGTGMFWALLFPFLCFFLKGQLMGWLYSLGFIGFASIYLFFLRFHLGIGFDYSQTYAIHYLELLCGFTVVAAGFNLLRTRFEERLQVRVAEETEVAKSYLTQIQYQASHDVLTGLPNRVELVHRLSQQMANAGGAGLVVCNLHVRRLHELSNILGHLGGDQLVLSIAEKLAASIGSQGILARTRRDEFVVICPLEPQGPEALALRRQIEQRQFGVEVQGYTLYVEFSVGVSRYPGHSTDASTLLKQAEQAMLQARKSDLPWLLYDPAQEQAFQRHHLLFSLMCEALAKEEFDIHLQPQVDLVSGRWIGAEALCRWHHPAEGHIPPGVFIPIAEESGLVDPLTDWLMDRCVRELRQWRSMGLELGLSINVSALTLLSPNFSDKIRACIERHGVPAQSITLELTESCFMNSLDRSLLVMHHLRSLGFRFSVDDFGTGFSSLSYLKHLPIQELKIDRAFVHKLLAQPGDQAIVTSTIGLAHQLGLTVVAEGIEDAASAAWLAARGCDAGQGYWFARPMPAADFVQMAMAQRAEAVSSVSAV